MSLTTILLSSFGLLHRIFLFFLVTISGEVFKGFFIQARDVATDGWLGEWIQTPNTKTHPECSAVTHADSRDKHAATLVWQAPKDAQPGQVYFT